MTDSEKLDLILSKVDGLETRFDGLETRFDRLEKEVMNIKITLDDEIRINIRRIAEGHLDLSRNLHEYVRLVNDVKAKQELQDIFIISHNDKLRAL